MAKMNKKTENSTFSRNLATPSGIGISVDTSKQARPQTPIKEIGCGTSHGLTQQQIADRAKAIWLKKGCPAGQDEKNWLEAEAQLKRELSIK